LFHRLARWALAGEEFGPQDASLCRGLNGNADLAGSDGNHRDGDSAVDGHLLPGFPAQD
jgi:hypothetical protein